MIRLDVDEETLRTGIGLESIVEQIIWYQIFWRDAIGKNIRLMKLQKDLYESKMGDSVYFDELKFDGNYNLLKPLCDTANTTFIGRVPDIVSTGSEDDKARISNFSLILKRHDFEEEISDSGLKMSICGSGFLALYADEGDTFPYFRSLDPLYTNVVYDCTLQMKRLFAYHMYFEKTSGKSKNIRGHYVVIIYTKDKMFAYKTSDMSIATQQAFKVFPYELFLIDGAIKSFSAEHGFNDIPIIEFMNNKECISDCMPALKLIHLYSELQNNRFQNVDDIINYLLVIKNARLGDEKESNDAINLIKNERVLPLEGDNVDAKFLSNPLNQTDIQTLANEYKNLIHYSTHIPDLSSVDFSQNASDPIIKIKTKPLLDLCREKEKWFNRGYFLLIDMALDFVKRNDKKLFNQIKFDTNKIDLVYSHALPSNDLDTVNMIVNLANAGLCNPRVLLQSISAIPNVDDYIAGMYEYNEYVDNRKKENQNKINSGVNETNIERQNQKVQDRNSQDNLANATKGESEKLSDNKVE